MKDSVALSSGHHKLRDLVGGTEELKVKELSTIKRRHREA